MKQAAIVETRNLSKRFGKLVAVDSVNLSINEGEIFGLLGPNGAGKTTIMSMLSTLLRPTSGTAVVNGHDVLKNPGGVRASIGVVFQETILDLDLTAEDNLDFHARLNHIPKEARAKAVRESLALVGLSDHAKRSVKTFSGGMKRRLETVRGMLHKPTILFLDEPTLGLDPQTRRHIWNYITKLNKERNITVMLTTHYLEEADALCSRIAIIDKGRIAVVGEPHKLKQQLKGDIVRLKVGKANKELVHVLKRIKGVSKVSFAGNEFSLTAANVESVLASIAAAVKRSRTSLESLSVHKPTLEDVFLHYVGRGIRND